MNIGTYTLTEMDFQILKYINEFSSVHRSDIEQHFNEEKNVIDYRLSKLANTNYVCSAAVPNSSYIIEEFEPITDDYEQIPKSLNRFHISEFGKTALQEHLHVSQAQRKEFLLKSIFTPIIVSFVTACISLYIIPRLPQIIKWVISSLSKIFS